eukprot:579269-Hanusia_phi.AAC.2
MISNISDIRKLLKIASQDMYAEENLCRRSPEGLTQEQLKSALQNNKAIGVESQVDMSVFQVVVRKLLVIPRLLIQVQQKMTQKRIYFLLCPCNHLLEDRTLPLPLAQGQNSVDMPVTGIDREQTHDTYSSSPRRASL